MWSESIKLFSKISVMQILCLGINHKARFLFLYLLFYFSTIPLMWLSKFLGCFRPNIDYKEVELVRTCPPWCTNDSECDCLVLKSLGNKHVLRRERLSQNLPRYLYIITDWIKTVFFWNNVFSRFKQRQLRRKYKGIACM